MMKVFVVTVVPPEQVTTKMVCVYHSHDIIS